MPKNVELARVVAPLIVAKAREMGMIENLPYLLNFGSTLRTAVFAEMEREPVVASRHESSELLDAHVAVCGDD